MAKRNPGTSSSKRVEHNPDDAFIGGVLQASSWAQQNRQLLTIIGVALAVIVGGLWYWVSFQGGVEQQAIGELERIQQTVGLGDSDAARGELQTFLERFGGTRSAGEARMILGQLHLEAGDAGQAIVVLEDAMRDLDEPVNLQSAMLLGAAYETEGRTADAISTYRRVASEATLAFQVTDARMAAARLLEAEGNTAEAISTYERVLDELEETSPNRALVQMRLAELRARS
ncbi:MAG: tetratricopeptide repeat protein [Gemmatimonadetes bacterium]|nr:tetratricopeptide repeat protein [Gemmatimonadota bacterium]